MTDTLTRARAIPEGPLPPQTLEAERSVLAAMLLDHESIGRALELLEGISFYRAAHQKVFDAIVALYNRNERADLVTVAEELRKRGELDAAGGPPSLSQIMEQATTSANLEEHARLVNQKWLLRSLISVANCRQSRSRKSPSVAVPPGNWCEIFSAVAARALPNRSSAGAAIPRARACRLDILIPYLPLASCIFMMYFCIQFL